MHCWWECKLVQPLWRTVWRFLKKLKKNYHMFQQSHFLDKYPQRMETKSQRDIGTPIFSEGLFTIANIRKQLKCPSTTDESIKKMWRYICIHTYKQAFFVAQLLSRVSFMTLWTIACQPPLSMGFPRQEYWSGLLFSSAGDLPNPGIEPKSPALKEDCLPTEPPREPYTD